jgi:putative hemolysin
LFIEISIVVVLTVINGLLAMSELAIVSSRLARLKVLQDQGVRGARRAIALAQNPGRFLSTVQIGITLVGVLSGAFSGATLGARLTNWLAGQGMSSAIAEGLGVGSVVVSITYLSLIVGELVPKQIALRDPEKVATRVAPSMMVLSKAAFPLVWLLDFSGRFVLGLLGHSGATADKMTEEEVRTVIAEAESAGVFQKDEREMLSAVMRLADRTARSLMTSRRDVEMIDLSRPADEIRLQIRSTRRTRLPVRDGDPDAIIGVVFIKDLQDDAIDGNPLDIRRHVRTAPTVMDITNSMRVLKTIRASNVHMALVFDEYGHFEGIISSGDILEAVTGAFREDVEDEPAMVERADGSYLVSGWMPIDEFSERLNAPIERTSEFQTVAGFVLHKIGHLPNVGEMFEVGVWKIEVVDLDGRRIDKILVSRK